MIMVRSLGRCQHPPASRPTQPSGLGHHVGVWLLIPHGAGSCRAPIHWGVSALSPSKFAGPISQPSPPLPRQLDSNFPPSSAASSRPSTPLSGAPELFPPDLAQAHGPLFAARPPSPAAATRATGDRPPTALLTPLTDQSTVTQRLTRDCMTGWVSRVMLMGRCMVTFVAGACAECKHRVYTAL